MPRRAPDVLADEITASVGPWAFSNARLRHATRKGETSLGVAIAMAGRDVWSDVALWSGGAPGARAAAAALKRSGYEILQVGSKPPFCARRPLHGLRELEAEVVRLEALAADASSLASFPARRPRPPGRPMGKGLLAKTPFQRLRERSGWWLESVVVCRGGPPAFVHAPGWTAGAWCLALDDGDDRRIDIHVQVFSKSSSRNVDPSELARLIRGFRSLLGPLGYKAVKIHWVTMNGIKRRPNFAVFTKDLATLAAARRERRVLDRALFGD